MAADAAAALDEDPGKTEPAAPAAQEPAKEETKDTASLDSKLDMILELLGKKEETPGADPLDSLVKKLTGEEAEPDVPAAEAKVVPAEELDKSACAADRAVMAAVIKQLRPVIAGIKDTATKKAVTDSLVECLTDKDKVSDIAKIAQATQKNAAKMADQKPQADLESYQAAYDAMNPHKNGGTK